MAFVRDILRNRNRFLAFWLSLLFSGLFFFVSTNAFSQAVKQDSGSSLALPIYRHYMSQLGATVQLYNGAEYEGSYPMVRGTPFWEEDGFREGTIRYEGIVYYNIPLAFDLVRGELVIRDPKNQRYRLQHSKLNYFILAGHTFEYHSPDNRSRNSLPEGIYDVLYEGDSRVFAKRSKIISRGFHAADRDSFSTRTDYYLYLDSTYYAVSREKDLLAIFRNEKPQLRKFWKQNKLDFKKEPESFILKTVSFWSQLKQ